MGLERNGGNTGFLKMKSKNDLASIIRIEWTKNMGLQTSD